MATYAIPPRKGVADFLNEATDANEKTIESGRRQALTLSQLKGEQQRQEGEALRQTGEVQRQRGEEQQQKIRQFQMADLERTNKIRTRFGNEVKSIYEVEENIPGAITQDVDGAQIRSPDRKRIRVINPYDNSPESLAANAKAAALWGRVNMEEGNYDPAQIKQMMELQNYAEKRGITSALEKFVATGSQEHLRPLEKIFGVGEGSMRIETVRDPKTDVPRMVGKGVIMGPDGKPQEVTRDLDPWFAMIGIDAFSKTAKNQMENRKAISAIGLQDAQTAAAKANAAAATQNANTNALLRQAQADALKDKPDPINTAAHKTSLYSMFTDAEGKNVVLPSASTNKARIQGQAEAAGLSRKDAARFADEEWAQIVGDRNSIYNSYLGRQKIDPKSLYSLKDKLRAEDESLSLYVSDYFKQADPNYGFTGRVKAFAERRSKARTSALTNQPKDDTEE